MWPSRRSLECRASMLAVAIACAGASVHLAVDVAVTTWRRDETPKLGCPGARRSGPAARPVGAVTGPAYLEAVAVRCRAADAPRCDLERAIDFDAAASATAHLFGDDVPEHAMLRFSPAHRRVVWTLRALTAGLTADVDAFDGTVVEFNHGPVGPGPR